MVTQISIREGFYLPNGCFHVHMKRGTLHLYAFLRRNSKVTLEPDL